MSDKEDFAALDSQIDALRGTPEGRKLLDLVEGLFATAVDKAVEAAQEHGPELVGRIIEGAVSAAVSKGLEKLQ
jgi:hypothetical protein